MEAFMKQNKLIVGIIASFMMISIFSSCVTQTRVNINSDVEGATVYIDGQKIGTTPVQVSLSNAVWEEPDVLLKKDGYKDLHTNLTKEVKIVNAVAGLLIWWPSLLWCYGPKTNQNYILTPEY